MHPVTAPTTFFNPLPGVCYNNGLNNRRAAERTVVMSDVEFIDLRDEITEDARGFSFYPLRGRAAEPEGLPAAFHLVSITAGQVRGNHLHPGRQEWLYPFHGSGRLVWEPRPGERRERLISGPRLLIRIPPGIPHALRNPGPEPLYLLAWREGAAPGEEPETVGHQLY
jgi:uncharacterized RmlC-like cupin family protein